MQIINGMQTNQTTCDSKFTFFRGRVKSQNDILVTNNTDMIKGFQIDDMILSTDHVPCTLHVEIEHEIGLDFLYDISPSTITTSMIKHRP